jgi:hypothetical protein
MCRHAKFPILIFNYKQDRASEKTMAGQPIGTIVRGEGGEESTGLHAAEGRRFCGFTHCP